MEKVMNTDTAVNESSDDVPEMKPVFDWLKKMGDRGLIKANVARMRASAIRGFVAILDGEESKRPEDVLANVETIAKRWAIKNSGTPDTANTYATRARGALSDYLAYQQDPTGFRFKMREVPSGERKKTPKPPKVSEATEAPDANEGHARSSAQRRTRDFPLNDEREITFTIPVGFTMREAARFAVHLVTLTRDYDPLKQTPGQAIASIVRVTTNASAEADDEDGED